MRVMILNFLVVTSHTFILSNLPSDLTIILVMTAKNLRDSASHKSDILRPTTGVPKKRSTLCDMWGAPYIIYLC